MIKISLCMIVKNEETVLERCLKSVKNIVDEIIIVDTGSTDATCEIAKKYTDKVFNFKWINDFSAARNFAFEKATMDYQMWLDADDVISENSAKQIKKLKSTLKKDVDIVTMKYITHFDANGLPIFSSTRERLLKRSKNYKWIDPVHECIPLVGNVFYSDIEIWHKKNPKQENSSNRNIKIYEALQKEGKEFSPRNLYYFARELNDHSRFEEASEYFEKFLATEKGWVEDNISTCFSLAICYKTLNKQDKILPILLKSFTFDAPRAEICSEIGYYYKSIGNFYLAFKWFDLATRLPEPNSIGFILIDYWGYIPNIEACVCLCALGDFKKANEYNERAGVLKPNNAGVLQNREFLKTKIND